MLFMEQRVIIVSDTILWNPRIEFTVFHEIMHYLLDEDGEIISYYTDVLRNQSDSYKRAIERCCNKGAAEFMMPQRIVRNMIDSFGFTVTLAQRIVEDCGASIVAAMLQLGTCAPVPTYAVLCAYGTIPRHSPPRRGLYVEYVGEQSGVRYPLARFSPIPGDNLLSDAWREKTLVHGASYVPFKSGTRMPCECEATRINDRVVGLLKLASPVSQNQLSLLNL